MSTEYTEELITGLFIKKTVLDLARYIAENYSGRVVEVGIGRFFAVSDYLERRGLEVIRTDIIRTREDVVVDDVCNMRFSIYTGTSLVYSIRPPYEIQGCILKLGEALRCDAIILPLKNEVVDGGVLVNYGSARFYLFTPRSRKGSVERSQTP